MSSNSKNHRLQYYSLIKIRECITKKSKKILLDANLEKTDDGEWVIKKYKLYEVSTNISD